MRVRSGAAVGNTDRSSSRERSARRAKEKKKKEKADRQNHTYIDKMEHMAKENGLTLRVLLLVHTHLSPVRKKFAFLLFFSLSLTLLSPRPIGEHLHG